MGYVLTRPVRFIMIYALLIGGTAMMYNTLPSTFLPSEDQGDFIVMAQLPAGTPLEKTEAVMERITDYFHENEKETVETVFTVNGLNFAGQGQNAGMAFVGLKDWSERTDPEADMNAIINRAMGSFSQYKDATVFAMNPPVIRELGSSTGFNFYLQDSSSLGHDKLIEIRNQLLALANQSDIVQRVRANGLEDTTQFYLDINYEKAKVLGVDISDINSALSIGWGSAYVNDFMDNGNSKKVYIQSEAKYRMTPNDLTHWYVRNNKGEMVAFSSFSSSHWGVGSPQLTRYNGVSAVNITGEAAPGYSTGDAMKEIQSLVAQLPDGVSISWTGLSYQEVEAGNQAPMLYAISALMVFLCLAALYESWTIPISVLFVIPLGVLGALAATSLRGLENDVYFQVGLLTTIGLSAKNAILIVEFAKVLRDQGMDVFAAMLQACKMRLRPILMTSLAFILGVLPLVISSGAGANARHSIGTSVMGGMLSATLLVVFFIPLFFILIDKLFYRKTISKA